MSQNILSALAALFFAPSKRMLVTCECRGILECLNLQGFAQANASQSTPFLNRHANRQI
jgi:hypothetical protein